MKRSQSYVLAGFGLFLVGHSLFPPRFSEASIDHRRTRGFVFGEHFEKVDLVEEPLTADERRSGLTYSSSYNEAVFDWPRYVGTLGSMTGLTLVLLSALSVFPRES